MESYTLIGTKKKQIAIINQLHQHLILKISWKESKLELTELKF